MAQQQQDAIEDNIGWSNSSDDDEEPSTTDGVPSHVRTSVNKPPKHFDHWATADTTHSSQNSERAPPITRAGVLSSTTGSIKRTSTTPSRKVSSSLTDQFKRQSKFLSSSKRIEIPPSVDSPSEDEDDEEEEEEEKSPGSFLKFVSAAYDTAHDKVHQFRYMCGVLVNEPNVQLFMVGLIMVNAMMMGIATFDFVRE
jgi:hypothetical protein